MVRNMDIPKLTHVRVNVRHLAASIEWYERLLGVTAQGHWPPQDPTYVHFNVGPAQFALGQYEPAPATEPGSSRWTTSMAGDGSWLRTSMSSNP